jgi:hypothetical protein
VDTQAYSKKYPWLVSIPDTCHNISSCDESVSPGFVSYSDMVYASYASGWRLYLCQQDDTRSPNFQELGFPEKRRFQHETTERLPQNKTQRGYSIQLSLFELE